MSKLKSQIPWDNYCMRKHGASIKAAVTRLGVEVNGHMMLHGTIRKVSGDIVEDNRLAKKLKEDLENNEVFITDQVGTC